MSILFVLQIVDRISRFAAEMHSMLSCRIRMAGPMSRMTWSAPWWLRSMPGSVSDFGEWFGSLVSTGETARHQQEGVDVKFGKIPVLLVYFVYNMLYFKIIKVINVTINTTLPYIEVSEFIDSLKSGFSTVISE